MERPSDLPLWKRLSWFVAIWGCSLATIGIVAFVIRFWLKA